MTNDAEKNARSKRLQWLLVTILVVINLALWVIPSDIVELVARDRHTLLGRYSRRHFTWIIAIFIISLIILRLHFSATKAIKKKRIFRLLAVLISLTVTFLAVDMVLRLTKTWRYEMSSLSYHRPPGSHWKEVFSDVPVAARTFPHAPPGYGTVKCTLSMDERGYRNPDTKDQYPVVVLGDSFAEGSRVSDEETWPRLFEEKSGAATCNLGMSGYAPQHYRAAMMEYGVKLKPRYVYCLLYEGNDFRSAKVTLKAPSEWGRFFKRSPIIEAMDQLLTTHLGPIGSHRPCPALDVLSWLPIAFPPGPNARYYTFDPDRLAKHYISRADFEAEKRWKRTRVNLEEILKLCDRIDAKLIVLYGPTKPHVVLPLVRSSLPAEKVRAFCAIKAKHLPPADAFIRNLFTDLDVKEDVTRSWCESRGVSFLSLTQPLRDAVRRGRQVFYTYDQHWSPAGHEVVADAVFRFWSALDGSAPAPHKEAPADKSDLSKGDQAEP